MAEQLTTDDIRQLSSWAESTEQYPVDFDKAWNWLGYSRKDSAKRILEREFKQNEDYSISVYRMAESCFEHFCLRINTHAGFRIRSIFTELKNKNTCLCENEMSMDDTNSQIQTWVESNIQFPIEYDKVWPWLGYSRKDSAKRILEREFKQNEDYSISACRPSERNGPRGGAPRHCIMLSKLCFKLLCLSCGTGKAKMLHKYYVDIETAYAADHPESKIEYDNDNLHKAFHEPFATNNELHKVFVCEESSGVEKKIADELAHQLNGRREVQIECGRIDIMTDTEVIEVKVASLWKHALGQVQAYAYETKLRPRIHLIGDVPPIAYTICKHFNVDISSTTL
jgi:hypothetical protein